MKFKRENIHPETLARRVLGGRLLYAPVVTVENCRLVFVSGLLARDREANIVGKGDMGAQIRQVGENLKAALAAAGATLDDLVRTTTYVTDIEEFFRHIEVRHEYLGRALPTSTTVEVRRLAHPDFMVEIEAFAAVAAGRM
jgi:enamine deaminase RidA (YjgF/YER057c/UK114 family)